LFDDANLRRVLQNDVSLLVQMEYEPGWGCGEAVGTKQLQGANGMLLGGQFWENAADNKNHIMFFWKLLQEFPEASLPWSCNEEYDKVMRKLVIHWEGPLPTTPMPAMQGCSELDLGRRAGGESLTDTRRKCVINVSLDRAPYLAGARCKPHKIPKNKKCNQAGKVIGDLINLAKSKLPRNLTKLCAVVWDVTVLFNTSITPDHTDEWDADGPGDYIMNICMNGDGIFVFTMATAEEQPMMGVYVGANHYTVFGKDLRYAATHQVFRLEPKEEDLDLDVKKPRPSYRMVLTVRFGNPSKKNAERWEQFFRADFDAFNQNQEAEQVAIETALKLTEVMEENASLKEAKGRPKKAYAAHAKSKPSKPQATTKGGKSDPVKLSNSSDTDSDTDADPFTDATSTSDDTQRRTRFAHTGSKVKLFRGTNCNATAVTEIHYTFTPDEVLETGMVFRLRRKDDGVDFDYQVVRVGIIDLPVTTRHGRGVVKRLCHAAWLLKRNATVPGTKWGGHIVVIEAGWVLGLTKYVLPLFAKACHADLTAAADIWRDFLAAV